MFCAGHLGSVGMIMSILTTITLFSLSVELIKLFVLVTSGTYQQLKFFIRRHNTEYIAWDSYCLYTVPVVRGLVAGQCRPQRLPAHPLQTTKIDSSHYSTLCNIKYCFIRVKSNVSSAIRSVHFLRFEFLSEKNRRV